MTLFTDKKPSKNEMNQFVPCDLPSLISKKIRNSSPLRRTAEGEVALIAEVVRVALSDLTATKTINIAPKKQKKVMKVIPDEHLRQSAISFLCGSGARDMMGLIGVDYEYLDRLIEKYRRALFMHGVIWVRKEYARVVISGDNHNASLVEAA